MSVHGCTLVYMSVHVCEIKLCLVFQCQGVDTYEVLSTHYLNFVDLVISEDVASLKKLKPGVLQRSKRNRSNGIHDPGV